MSPPTVSTKLAQIAKQSEQNPTMVFTTLAHLMDEDFLTEAFHQLRKDAAAGIDEVTATEYAINLGKHIKDLHQRLAQGKYRAQPARRVWIPKSDGGQRPLAILVLEDKIAQRAVAMILEAIYEGHFYDFSCGFRRHYSAHTAIIQLRHQCLKLGINWIIDADIRKFFDTISWNQLRTILQSRMNDGGLLRLIGMWLHVGVLEQGQVVNQEIGTPQGAPISPILANIFLHVVLDDWFQNKVRPWTKGNCCLVRYADDFVMGFSVKTEAEAVYRALPKRFERFGLSIHPEKSRLVQFSRPFGKQGKGPGSFNFLGFTHYWAKTLKGGWTIKRKTQGKRLSRFLSGVKEWCQEHLHQPLAQQHQMLSAKLRGHYQYYGVRGNFKMLEVAYEHTRVMWKKWLGRRNSKNRMSWERFAKQVAMRYALPLPQIMHVF